MHLRSALLAALVVSGCARASSFPVAALLLPTPAWPGGLPADSVLASWDRLGGDFRARQESVTYELYVDPAYPGLYRVTRFRSSSKAEGTVETVVWSARPGQRGSMECFQRRTPEPAWAALTPGSDAYKRELARAIEVYGQHRQKVLN